MNSNELQQRNIIDFITIAAEYCALVENDEKHSLKSFIEKSRKILALLYLKASLLPKFIIDEEEYIEKFVSENDWNFIQSKIALKFGEFESYFDITEPIVYGSSNETTNVSISECFADIYQDLRDMLEVYRLAGENEQQIAILECSNSFKSFWGIRTLLLMNELHLLEFSDCNIDDSEVEDSIDNSDEWED